VNDPCPQTQQQSRGYWKKVMSPGAFALGLADTAPYPRLQMWRRGDAPGRRLQSIAHPFSRLEFSRTGGTLTEMLHHLGNRRHRLVAEMQVQLPQRPFAYLVCFIHACPLVAFPIPYDRATSVSSSRNTFLPRLRRDITVPIGIVRISDASLYENSSTSTSNTTERKSAGIRSSAARMSWSV